MNPSSLKKIRKANPGPATRAAAGNAAVVARAKLPLDDLIDQFKDLLSVSWNRQSREALINALEILQRGDGPVRWGEFQVIEDQTSDLLGVPVGTAIKQPLLSVQESSYLKGMQQAGKEAGVSVMWNLPDTKSLRTLDRNTQFWIGSYFDDNLQEGFRGVMRDFFEGGYNRKELSTLMRVHFQNVAKKGDGYWDLLADHTATKIREIGRVSGYEKAGIEVVRIRARIDAATTVQCRSLHGHVISVKDLRGQVNNYLKACDTRNKDRIKKSWPWWTEKDAKKKLNTPKKINNQIKAGKVGLPPFHARCRTITVAEFVEQPGAHVPDVDWPEGMKDKPMVESWRPKRKPKKRQKLPDGVRRSSIDDRLYVRDRFSQDMQMVEVNMEKLNDAWKKDNLYLPKNRRGATEVDGRRKNFRDWLKQNQSTPIEMPTISYNEKTGIVTFVDGRHRTAVLRDLGDKTMWVVVEDDLVKIVVRDFGV
jgi:hypothetical protein